MSHHGIIFNVSEWIGSRGAGAYRIAHVLREEGWDIEVIEFAAQYRLEELKALIDSRVGSDTKFVGFSNQFNFWNIELHELTKYIKRKYSNVVLLGGSNDGIAWRAHHIDYFIQGYAEVAIFKLLKWLFSNGEKPNIREIEVPGLAHKFKAIAAMDDYPAYPMKDLSVIYEKRDFIDPSEWLSMELSRGCIFKCKFCSFPILGVKGDYTRSVESFERSIKDTYDKFGSYKYLATDETFNDNTSKVSLFADAVESLDFDPYFAGFIRADLAITRGEAEWEQLARMNFFGQYYGVESFNHPSAKAIGKGMKSERIKQGLLDMKDYYNKVLPFYRGELSFINGLPHETEDTINSTLDWLDNNWQGEAVKYWRLVISEPTALNRGSQFTREYEKHGYRRIGNRANYSKDERVIDGWEIPWENDIMNIYEANEIQSRIDHRLHHGNFAPGIFDLGNYVHYSIEDAMYSPRSRNMNRNEKKKLNSRRTKLINTYFEKKMSI